MSMLSAQCDELRQMAESVGLAMPQAATLMMDAADTILSLRDRAQDLQAERDKLRDENQSIGMAAYELGRNSMADENAKLRDFASESFSMAFNFYHGAGTAEDLRELKVEYHELGIECGDDCE